MKTAQLLNELKIRGLRLPEQGSGPLGKITNDDLIKALGDYEIEISSYSYNYREHLKLRRAFTPMKAYRLTNLSKAQQRELWKSTQYCEKKENGWRVMVTCIKDKGVQFWGGNISTVNFLPVNYSNKIFLNPYIKIADFNAYSGAFIIDCECICRTFPEQANGYPATDTREAVAAILGSDVERAIKLQVEENHVLEFIVHDLIDAERPDDVLSGRLLDRRSLITQLGSPQFKEVKSNRHPVQTIEEFTQSQWAQFKEIKSNRHPVQTVEEFTQSQWAQGNEGTVVKFDMPYAPGKRLRTHAVKIKRTAQQDVGKDIDAFLMSTYATPEWAQHGMIGGVNLGVWYRGEKRIIASISSMSIPLREKFTTSFSEYENKVVTVNGQELSSRNLRLMHATTDWVFRDDKSYVDCDLEIPEEKF